MSDTVITAPSADAAKKRGFFAEMLHLWLEHNRRMMEVGVQPL